MSLKVKAKFQRKIGYFGKSGTKRETFPLITAAYYDHTDTARALIFEDPEQIDRQDPFAGLAPIHIAVFRQNAELVELLAKHPRTDFGLRDNFGRRAVDMLDYTTDQAIFELVMEASYPDQMRDLVRDEVGKGNVVSIVPKTK